MLTVRGWFAQIVEHRIRHGLPLFTEPGEPAGLDLFPTERGTLVSEAALRARFRRYRDELGLSPRAGSALVPAQLHHPPASPGSS